MMLARNMNRYGSLASAAWQARRRCAHTLASQLTICFLGFYLAVACPGRLVRGEDGPVAWWSFDGVVADRARDQVGKIDDLVLGNSGRAGGVVKTALKCDGFTTCVVRPAASVPRLSGGFTVEAWIAIRAYPWGWCPIVSQRRDQRAGYFLGIDAEGHLGLQLAVDGKWTTCTSRTKLPLLKWVHVAGCFDPRTGLRLFVDGALDADLPVRGKRFRVGHHHALEGTDLVIWFEKQSTKPLQMTLSPVNLVSR